MTNTANKTFICSVVFLDIVQYSRKPVDEQIRLKSRFNALLSEAIKDVAVNDRIILDTGDGAAISFLGDPEDALFVALNLRDAMIGEKGPDTPPIPVRIGINLGPVKLVRDINRKRNLIGDGINIAQRVMSFAEPGQVLVSRSYYDVISCLSREYANLFHYEGPRADKNVREHQIYSVDPARKEAVPPPEAPAVKAADENVDRTGETDRPSAQEEKPSPVPPPMPEAMTPVPPAATGDEAAATKVDADKTSVTDEKEAGERRPESGTPRKTPEATARRRAKVLWIAAPLIAFLIVVAIVVGKKSGPTPPAPAPTPAATTTVAPASPVETKAPAATAADPKGARTGKTAEKPTADGQKKSETATSPDKRATVSLGITPWGEVYVDGNKKGVSPPLNSLQVAPGKHQIEIRNTSFPPYQQTVDLKPGELLKIKHKFR
jgi:class 3 adenylate cyclase